MAITSFEVGAVFRVQDEASRTIAKLGETVSALGRKIEKVQLQLAGIDGVNFDALLGRIGTLSTRIDGLTAQVGGLKSAWGEVASAASAAVAASGGSISAAAANVSRAAERARRDAQRTRRELTPSGVPAIRQPGPQIYPFPWGNPNVPLGASVPSARQYVTPYPWGIPPEALPKAPRVPREESEGGGGGRGSRGHPYAKINSSGNFSAGYSGGSLAGQGAIGLAILGGLHYENMQDAAARTVVATMRGNLTAEQRAARRKQFEDIVRGSDVFGYGVTATADAEATTLRLLGTGFSWKQKIALMPELLRDYAYEARMMKTDYADTASAMAEFAHQATSFSPEELHQANAAISALSTMMPKNVGLPTVTRAMGYALPLLTGMGFDQTSTEEAVGLLLRAGLGTRSGTWVRTFGQKLVTPPKKNAREWVRAMHLLGLMDQNNNPTYRNAEGKLDILKAVEIAEKNVAKLPMFQRNQVMQAFQTRGLEFEAIAGNPKVLEQLESIKNYLKEFTGKFGAVKEDLSSDSYKQQLFGSWGDFDRALTDLSAELVPGFTQVVKNLGAIFKSIDNAAAPLIGDNVGRKLAGGALIGAVAGFVLSGFNPVGAAIGSGIGLSLTGIDFSKSEFKAPLAGADIGAVTGAIIGAIIAGPMGAAIGAGLGGIGGGLLGFGYKSLKGAGKNKSGSSVPESLGIGDNPFLQLNSYYGRGASGSLLQNAAYYPGVGGSLGTVLIPGPIGQIVIGGAGIGAGGAGGGGLISAMYTTGGAGGGGGYSGGGYSGGGGSRGPMGNLGGLGSSLGGAGSLSLGGGSAASFDKIFKGTALQGHWGDVVSAAKANGIDPGLMAAIMAHETGHGSVLTGNNVAGIMGGPGGGKSSYSSITAGINDAARVIAKDWKRAGGNLDRMAGIYAPIGAGNDPRGLNRGWASGVRSYLGKLGGRNSGVVWNYFQKMGLSPGQVPTTLIHTPYGSTHVASAAAGDFTGFFNTLHDAGAPIHKLSEIVRRNKRWGGGLSSHSYGSAIDIDDARYFSPEMKAWVASHPDVWSGALHKYHMNWGHSIHASGGPDDPHIEWGGPGSGDSPSDAIASHGAGGQHETHINLKVDGRTLTKVVHKHTARMGNMPSRGGRMHDPFVAPPTFPM